MTIGAFYSEYDWISALKMERDKAKKQFILEAERKQEQKRFLDSFKTVE